VDHPDIFAFSRFVGDLSALAGNVQPTCFRREALQLLRSQLDFQAAVWGTASIGAGLSFREVMLFGLPDDAAGVAAAAASADPRLMQVLGAPGAAHAYSITPDDPPVLQQHAEELDIQHIMSIAAFDVELGLANGIVLLRPQRQRGFAERDCVMMEAAFPHLLRAWSENQTTALKREIYANSRQPRFAAASHHGILAAVDEEFLRLFRLEWPDWRGPLLPEPVRALLLGSDAERFAGRSIILSVRRGHDVSLLQVRRRVAADDLRPRERTVAELCASGASYRDIADRLGIAPSTARNHIAAVHRRLGVNRNSAIAAMLTAAY
jgi:DNA-binding CsgD family transcriptional regulator